MWEQNPAHSKEQRLSDKSTGPAWHGARGTKSPHTRPAGKAQLQAPAP